VEKALGRANDLLYNPMRYRIFETASRLFHDPAHRLLPGHASLLSMMPDNCTFCIGEEHNHPMHHAAEFRMLKALVSQSPPHLPLALGLEMFDGTRDHEAALHDFVFGSDDLADLKRRTSWDQNWGWPIRHWAKLLNYAKANKMQIIGLNCPTRVSDFVESNGIDGLLGKPRFPEVDLSDAMHRHRFFKERHGLIVAEAPSKQTLSRQYQAQTLREEWMAEQAAGYAKATGGRLLCIMGRNHVAGRRGVPNRIARRLGSEHGWAAPYTIILQGAEWQSKDCNLPTIRGHSLPGIDEADWVWYTEHNKGCTMS